MTKADKIKICREFESGLENVSYPAMVDIAEKYGITTNQLSTILRWGLKHPEELRKGNK